MATETRIINGRRVPVIPPRPPEPPYDPDPTVAVCGQCGIELKRVMCFSCQDPRCPCFTRVMC